MILPRRGSGCGHDSVLLLVFVVAASLGAALAKDTAFVEVVLFESSPNGDYTTYTTGLQGRFSKAGATISAEGEIVQVGAKCCLFLRGGVRRAAQARTRIPPCCCSSNFFHESSGGGIDNSCVSVCLCVRVGRARAR